MLKSLNKNSSYLFISLSILFLLSYYLTQYFHNNNHSGESEAHLLSEQIDSQSVKLLRLSDDIASIVTQNPNKYWLKLDSVLHKSKYVCFITSDDSLNYWNTNKVDVVDFNDLIPDNNIHIANLPSGWYLYSGSSYHNKNIFLLELIKADFQVNNELLAPGYNPVYTHNHNIELTLDIDNASYVIVNATGQSLLGINYNTNQATFNNDNIIIFLLFLLSYTFLLFAILQWLFKSKLNNKNPIISFSVFVVIVTIIRLSDIYFNFPHQLKTSSFFTNNIFNIPITNTAGDLIVNIVLLVIFSIAAYRFLGKNQTKLSPVNILLLHTVLWVYILVILYILSHAVYDQNISFFSENILKNNDIFLLVFVIIGLNVSLYYVFVTYLNSYYDKKVPFFIPFLISFIGLTIVYLISDVSISLLTITLVFTYILIILKQFFWRYTTDKFLNHLILLVLIAIVSSVIVSNSYKYKNDKYQEFIAQSMAVTNDALFEYSYENIIEDITIDQYLIQIAFNDTLSTETELEEYIQSKFFKGYINKFDIQVTNCGENELLEIQPEGEIYDCDDYFNSLIIDFTIPVIDSFLFQFNSGTESIYYISKITLTHPADPGLHRNLFIEFVSSHVPEGLGYPELLIDKRSSTLNLSQYSFAMYSNNHLTYKFGDFGYNTFLSFTNDFQLNQFFSYENYRHFAVHVSDDNYLIISREETRTTMKIVVFSIVFLLLSLISIVVYILVYARKAIYLFRLNFKARLQTFVIASLTLTFILMAGATLFYIEDRSREDLEKQLTEKSNSVLIELQHKLSSVSDFKSQDTDFLHQLLRKFSLVFFSDINLYDKSGFLIATSRPEIFEKSLLSTYINPSAYNAIFFENKLNFITEENIGSLKYYSAYVPINLNNNYPIGIVNLPYFARQTEFTKSYYIMLSYLINIYVIIGIIGTLIAIIFSRYLTRPLVLLQENLASIRIDKHNEKIQWNKNDEIGMLIHEYNRMVDKLEQSADLLKHSERESAWREVARQIAHEIKNPLTPMKLNVQYLLKSYKNDDPEFDSKINSISKSLITQIDTLDNVAEMFTDFAKSKSLDFVKVDLNNVLISSVNLFNKNTNVSISLSLDDDTELITLGFEKDILRVINNILKNAIQSVGKNSLSEIKINVRHDSKFITVAISDNGKGISEEMKLKIFQPYFTTKTSGTGLGLAIVKNIMNEIGGDVYFESGTHEGTTFFLNFPVAS